MVELPVLQNSDSNPAPERERQRIAEALRQLDLGEVRFGGHDRMLYATDASIYQVEPLGVVLPRDVAALAQVVAWCGQNQVALLPRGGGTSLPGQCTNRAVVVDYSPRCRSVLDVDAPRRECLVEPGITVDELNRQLDQRKAGLFFAPDPATAAQATIGGCIGNNAAGARSIRYGRTTENVAAVDVVLTTGERTWLGAGAGHRSPVARRLAQGVCDIVGQHAALIRQRYPKTMRRNAGYALDLVLQQMERGVSPEDLDLSGLICGSEGTLAVVLAARLRLHPVPHSKGLAIVSFASLDEAIRAVVPILATGPSAVELLDDVVLAAARGNAECRGYMDLLADVAGTPPQAVLYVEYQETGSLDEVRERFAQLRRVLPGAALREYLDKSALLRAWALRKAGEPLLHGLATQRKPVTCVEDNAVPVERLVEFVARFKEIVTRHGTKAAYYAHASVGVLHVRPMLDLHAAHDRDLLRAIATEVADLAQACGGVMSGEHGDGRLRGPLLERFYGPELLAAFRAVKELFDPPGILNPGNIVGAGPITSMTQKLRVAPAGQALPWPGVETYFDYHDQEGLIGAVEMCSGAGVCRKTAGGTMCPSYRATLDERHSTRGRANALRLAISGQLEHLDGAAAWEDPEVMATLALCLSCKACKTECPSNVDMARLKAEFLAQHYKILGKTPLAARVFGQVRKLNALGSKMPRLANWAGAWPPFRAVLNRLLGLAPQRTLPPFAPSLYRWFEGRRHEKVTPENRAKVVLFADCFVTYSEPEIGRKVVEILEALGYEVALPRVGCCGRSMISTGLLPQAIAAADTVLRQLRPAIEDPAVQAIVVCEPSCLSAMKDDWLQLKLQTELPLRQKLAAKAMLVEDFIEQFWDRHPVRPAVQAPVTRPVLLHGHCHQKALWGEHTSATLLRRLVGEKLQVLPSGCCGMAGAFGYAQEKYDVSMAIGEQSLFSLLRQAPPDALVVAPGTSCRHQIRDGTGRHAVHPMDLVATVLGVAPAIGR